MDKGFDPYWEWLRIPTDRRPPTHYELLELPAFETNTERIREAATRRMAEILRYRLGEHAGESRRLQNDISRALNCLSDSAQKQRYDIQLRAGRPGDAASAPPPIVQAYLHAEAGAAPTGRSPSPGWTSLPESFGPYRIERTLGEGAMGTVYLARDTKLGRQVAIKVPFGNLDERSEWLERFRRECRATALFNHPNLCTVYEAGQVDGWPYLAMAYIEGRSLAEWSGRPMPARQAASLVMKVARGMSEAHRLGVLHRDL
ncbi:MAG TPA: serine/threonine-protein kinase, partial [Pirellulales bacterium]|nr:serine/threonine-protein kinase [Pirellulales bacterium]